MSLEIIPTKKQLRDHVEAWRKQGLTIAVVPTMGALHDGHLSLVRLALSYADRVIVTLFVNPKQFNNADDLTSYPRREDEDRDQLAALGVHILYAPAISEIYPVGFATTISVAGVSEGLCGANRPGHFDGVATVVTKLLLQTRPDIALFGEKDFQQLQVIKRLVRDLDIAVEIKAGPTMREPDGLAMSSRNIRLSREERAIAPALAAVLFDTAAKLTQGASIPTSLAAAEQALMEAGYREIEYIELRAEDGLAPVSSLDQPARLLVAAWLGDVRLIDNVPVKPHDRLHA